MTRNCDCCGRVYEAQRRTSRFCSARCRVRNNGAPPSASARRAAVSADDRAVVSLAESVRIELDAKNLAHTTSGRLALSLAARIDSPYTADASRAPLSREFSRLYESLMASVADAADPVDQIRAHWRSKRAGAPLASSEFIASPHIVR